MCGITGFWNPEASDTADGLRRQATAMAARIRHRGPDSSDVWVDPEVGVGFGHRRLAILDLTPTGRQPMASADGRYVLCYNGEVYNFPELRAELEAAGRGFRGTSDTEVMVEGFCEWGVDATVRRLVGMFAFALWDRRERQLHLVRDRVGVKPLYWGRFGELVVFGSELKALLAHPGWRPQVDRHALSSFLRHNYIPAPHSIYRGVAKLEPGRRLTFRRGREPSSETFWDLEEVACDGIAERGRFGSGDEPEAEATDRLEALLRDAVRGRMLSDVPLGAFLSGGIDSSLVVALMQAQSDRPVRTFSIGFRDADFDEASHARTVAEHLGTEHTELYVEPRHALDVVPRLAEDYDEPFSDASQIPTFLVSEMTRRHVTVCLSGDGGDELFAGYQRYFDGARLDRYYRLPRIARRTAAHLLGPVPPSVWDAALAWLPGRNRSRQSAGATLQRLLRAEDGGSLYRTLISHWQDPQLVAGVPELPAPLWNGQLRDRFPDFLDRVQYLDSVTYLPDDILTKVDRASMAVSLEARVPILDHRVVELAWGLPQSFKVRDGESKWLLRRVLDRYLPRRLFDRPKMGFAVPIGAWLREPLRDWAEELLDERRLRSDGLLDPRPIRRKWEEHLAGRRNWQYLLWDVLMFQAWKERWL